MRQVDQPPSDEPAGKARPGLRAGLDTNTRKRGNGGCPRDL